MNVTTTDIDLKDLERRVAEYIKENFIDENKETFPRGVLLAPRSMQFFDVPAAGAMSPISVEDFDFKKLLESKAAETFSEMLIRLIKDSGEKNSVIYHRANIDRRHFAKIVHRKDYQPGKQTVLAFAVALKLSFDATQKFLAAAGFTLNKSSMSDVIVSFFLEHEIFDVNLVNEILYKYNQPLLGG